MSKRIMNGENRYCATIRGEYWGGRIISNCTFRNSSFLRSGASESYFKNCDFSHSTMKEMAFVGCTFVDCDFIGTVFKTGVLARCHFENCDFKGAIFKGFRRISTCTFDNECIFSTKTKGIRVELMHELTGVAVEESYYFVRASEGEISDGVPQPVDREIAQPMHLTCGWWRENHVSKDATVYSSDLVEFNDAR